MTSPRRLRIGFHPLAARSRMVLGWTLAGCAMVAAVLLVLGPVSWLLAGNAVRSLHGKDQADALNAVRQTVLAASGGVAVLVGAGYTARTYQLSRRGQATQRFSAAVEQLASDKMEIRLGGIYGLEHLMAESAPEHLTVVSLLASFVRERTRLPRQNAVPFTVPPPRTSLPPGTDAPADIHAALTALARRPEREETRRLDLREAGLAGAILRKFDLGHSPRLSRAYLTGADLRSADLRGADLQDAILNGADLSEATLAQARLDGAALIAASLREAHLGGASLVETDLCGADLTGAKHLHAEQLTTAVIDEHTLLPADLAGEPWVAARIQASRIPRRSSA